MNIKRKIVGALLALAAGAAALGTTALPAEAATYKWANTENASYSMRGFYAYPCDTSRPNQYISVGARTSIDICSFTLPRNYGVYAYVKETGTVIWNYAPCSSTDRRLYFSNQNDTSRTAVVNLQICTGSS